MRRQPLVEGSRQGRCGGGAAERQMAHSECVRNARECLFVGVSFDAQMQGCFVFSKRCSDE